MRGNKVWAFALCSTLLLVVSCRQARMEVNAVADDTQEPADTLESDSVLFFQDEDEGLSLEYHATEVFGDFIFAFTHNTRFQAERIRFPLPVTDTEGEESVIRSGRQFRSEFRLPGNDYYTLLLGDINQMSVFQNDTALSEVSFQCVNLQKLSMVNYDFRRTDGRWYLTHRHHGPLSAEQMDFFHFYQRFVTDTLFQEESLAPQLSITIPEDEEDEQDEEEVEGTIDRSQWPVFRPGMPRDEFVNIYFGQTYPDPHTVHLLQCGISNGLLDIFTFRREEGRWRLTSYEN